MMTFAHILFALKLGAALSCGLMAGVFFAFSTLVMIGLRRLPASAGIAAMQFINLAAVQSLFGVVFMLTPVVCLLTMSLALWRWQHPSSVYILLGGALYLIGSLLVTVVCNIPQNNALAALAPNDPNSANKWSSFLNIWMFWNHVRTVTSLAATASFTLALSY